MILVQVFCQDYESGATIGEYYFTDLKKAYVFMKKRKFEQAYYHWFACAINTDLCNNQGWCSLCDIGEDPEKIKAFF